MKEKILDFLGRFERKAFVAGGAITSLHTNAPINDFDIYPKSVEARENLFHDFFDSGFWCVHVSDRAITFTQENVLFQIMTFDVFETAEKIFDYFDFTVCMGAFDMETEQFILHKDFLLHNSKRILKFNPKTKFPYASVSRVEKYKERGYTIGKAEFFKILMTCQNLPINSWEALKQQFGGIYGESIDIPETEFSFDAAMEAISSIKPVDYKHSFGSAREAIIATTDRVVDVYTCEDGDVYYRENPEETNWFIYSKYAKKPLKPKNPRFVTKEDIINSQIFYVAFHNDKPYQTGLIVAKSDKSLPYYYPGKTVKEIKINPEHIITFTPNAVSLKQIDL